MYIIWRKYHWTVVVRNLVKGSVTCYVQRRLGDGCFGDESEQKSKAECKKFAFLGKAKVITQSKKTLVYYIQVTMWYVFEIILEYMMIRDSCVCSKLGSQSPYKCACVSDSLPWVNSKFHDFFQK